MSSHLVWALIVATLVGVQTVRLSNEEASHAMTVAQHATERGDWEREARRATEAAREEERRRTAAHEEIADEATTHANQARADADRAADAGRRLQQRVATLTAQLREVRGRAAAAEGGSSAGDPIGVLADVLGRCDRRAGVLAEYADAAGTAGRACERAYDALNTGVVQNGAGAP